MRTALLTLVLIPLISAPVFGVTVASPAEDFKGKVSVAEPPSESTWRVVRDIKASSSMADSISYDLPVCWSDMYDLTFTKVSSEIIPSLFETEIADDI